MKNFLIAGLLVITTTTTVHAASEREMCYTTADALLNFAVARDAGVSIDSVQEAIKTGMAGPGAEDKDAKPEQALLRSVVTVYQSKDKTPAAIHNDFLDICLTKIEK